MNKVIELLKGVGVFYVGSIDGDQVRVRPFSSCTEFEGNAYICTNNTKDCYHQWEKNPKTEISGMGKDGTWIRVTATLVRDDRDEARQAMLDDPTGPKNLYHVGDGKFEVLRLENVHAVKYSFTKEPEVIC